MPAPSRSAIASSGAGRTVKSTISSAPMTSRGHVAAAAEGIDEAELDALGARPHQAAEDVGIRGEPIAPGRASRPR